LRTVEKSSNLGSVTNPERAGAVVFVQEASTKSILQSEYISFGTLAGTGEEVMGTPLVFSLEQNYPNPFNPSTTIRYTVGAAMARTGSSGGGSGISGAGAGWVSLAVYDLLRREVAVLMDGPQEPGSYAVSWAAAGLASGVYVYRLTAGSWAETRRMALLR
jgi:hypothetical protein